MINTGSYDLEPSGDFYQTGSPDHGPASACGYFVNDAHIYGWWKGQGSPRQWCVPRAVSSLPSKPARRFFATSSRYTVAAIWSRGGTAP